MTIDGLFGRTLRRTRVERNKTIRDVAEKLGLSVTYISDIERGRRGPLAPSRVAELADFLGAPRGELLRAAALSTGWSLELLREARLGS